MGSTLTNLTYHVVFSTKNRENLLHDSFRDSLYSYLGGIILGEKGKLIKIGGTKDHVHILAKFSPAVTVSNMLQHIKGNSSKWVNDKKFLTTHFYWQRGYGAFSVSESMLNTVATYIENQAQHHRKMTFKEEFLILLEKHNIAYDEQYLWE